MDLVNLVTTYFFLFIIVYQRLVSLFDLEMYCLLLHYVHIAYNAGIYEDVFDPFTKACIVALLKEC